MAIVSVVERLGYDHDWSFGERAPVREYTRYFWVYSDTRDESPVAVRTATGVPQPPEAHPNDAGSIVQRIRVRKDEEAGSKRWEVECSYSSALSRDVKDDEPDDIEDFEKISVVTRQGQLLTERDINGALIKNTAGDLIEGVQIPWNALTIQIEQYTLASPDYYVTSRWINAINSATWRGVPAYFAKIASINYDETQFESHNCWRRTTSVDLAHVDTQPWGWRHRILNAGLRELSGGSRKHIRDDVTQAFISRPVPLNSDGTKMALGGTPYYLDKQVYPEYAFSGLGI